MEKPVLRAMTKRAVRKYKYDTMCYKLNKRIILITLDEVYESFKKLQLYAGNLKYTFGHYCDHYESKGYKIV